MGSSSTSLRAGICCGGAGGSVNTMGVGAGGSACDTGAGIDICFGTGTLTNTSGEEREQFICGLSKDDPST